MGLLTAFLQRDPFEPYLHTGDESVLTYAGPSEQGKVLASVDFALGLVDNQLSEAWGTEVVVASCEDVLTFVEFHTALQLRRRLLRTAVGVDQPVASAVAGSHVAGAVGGRPGLETSFFVEQPCCVAAYLVPCHDTTFHIESVLPSSEELQGLRSSGVSSWLDWTVQPSRSRSSGYTDCPFQQLQNYDPSFRVVFFPSSVLPFSAAFLLLLPQA